MRKKWVNRIKGSSLVQASSYFIFKISAYLISIISIPILTKKFSVVEYGTLSLIESSIALISSFCLLGLPQAYIRYYEVEKKVNTIKSYDVTTFALISAIAVTTFVISCIFFKKTYGMVLAVIVALVTVVTVSFQQLIAFFRARGLLYLHSAVLGFNEIAMFLLPLVGVIWWQANIETYFICKLIIGVIFLGMVLYKIKPQIHKREIDINICKKLLLYGCPLLLLGVGSTIFSNGDRVIIDILYGKELVAYYTIPSKLSHALQQILIYPISMVIFPQYVKIWENYGETQTKQYLSKGLHLYLFIIAPIIMGSIIIREDLILVLSDERYLQADYLIPILVASLLIYGMYYFIAAGYFLGNKTLLLGIVMSISAVLNIILNVLLGTIWGLKGIGIATGVAYLFFLGVSGYISNKTIALSFPFKNASFFIMRAIIMYIILQIIQIQTGNAMLNVVLNIVIGGSIYILLNARYIWRILNRGTNVK